MQKYQNNESYKLCQRKFSMISFALILSSLSVSAHQDASDPSFCARGEMIEIGLVKISGDSLNQILSDKPINCPVGIKDTSVDEINKDLQSYVGGVITYRNKYAQRHDFFDNTPARMAYGYASCICSSMINDDYNPAQVRPLIIGPDILLDENHHVDYTVADGIIFSCQVCK